MLSLCPYISSLEFFSFFFSLLLDFTPLRLLPVILDPGDLNLEKIFFFFFFFAILKKLGLIAVLNVRHKFFKYDPKTKVQKHTTKVSDITESEERKTVKSQSHVFLVHRCEGHCPLFVHRARQSINKSTWWLIVHASLSSREETRIVAGQFEVDLQPQIHLLTRGLGTRSFLAKRNIGVSFSFLLDQGYHKANPFLRA